MASKLGASSSKARTTILYGESGDLKTTSLYYAAKYLLTKVYPGTTARLISADGGGYVPFQDDPEMIDAGLVDAVDISNSTYALADLHRLGEGYWYRGDPRFAVESISRFRYRTPKAEFKKISLYIIEGISSISSLWLGHISRQPSTVSNDGSMGFGFKHSYSIEQDGYYIGGLGEGHFGIVQGELHKLVVQEFGTLPVKHILWSALVGSGTSKLRQSETVYGPKAAGNALTPEIPSWVQDCLHLQQVIATDKEGDAIEKKVAWFRKHLDPNTDVPYLAKPRVIGEDYPKLLAKFPKGYINLGHGEGIVKYFKFLEDMKAARQPAAQQAQQATQTSETSQASEEGKE